MAHIRKERALSLIGGLCIFLSLGEIFFCDGSLLKIKCHPDRDRECALGLIEPCHFFFREWMK